MTGVVLEIAPPEDTRWKAEPGSITTTLAAFPPRKGGTRRTLDDLSMSISLCKGKTVPRT